MGNKENKEVKKPVSTLPDPSLSKWHFQVVHQSRDYRTESIQAVEIPEASYNEMLQNAPQKGACVSTVCRPRSRLEKFQDYMHKVRDGGITRLVEQSYMPLEATPEDKAKVSAGVKALCGTKALRTCMYSGEDKLTNAGRDGKHNYLFIIEEPSIFKEPVTYVDLRVRYQRL